MKKPDEIKKGLEHCINGTTCRGCPYCEECATASDCNPMQKDLQGYIQQLEREQPIWHILPYDLPPYTGSYIVCTASGKVCTAKWYEQRNDFAGIGRKHIVAWQWLPLGITVEVDNDEIC